VENGKPVHPVSEATIAGNLNDIFSGIVGVGDDVDRRGNVHCGSLLVKAMTVAA
jgi:PmbA protein